MIRKLSQWFVFFAAVGVLAVAVLFIQNQIQAYAERPAPVKHEVAQHPDVSVIAATASAYQARVTGYGAASPHFELALTARVAGQVETLGEAFEPGKRLKKGDLLASLEDSDYQAAVATARKDLEDARLSLLEEQRQGLQAKMEWEDSGLGGEPASELVLRKPQLAAAQAAVTQAEAALASARNDLEQTLIVAPFDALVVERKIAPGSYVQAGTEIALLYSTDRVEVAVSLSSDDWDKLPDASVLDSGRWPVELADVQNGRRWSGHVLRTEQHLEANTRQRSLVVAVEDPFDTCPALLPGTFVEAAIGGRELDAIWKLPSSAFSQKGEIWYVSDDGVLESFVTDPVFSDADAIYITAPEALSDGEQKVLVHPLSSYLKGMAVNPVPVEPALAEPALAEPELVEEVQS